MFKLNQLQRLCFFKAEERFLKIFFLTDTGLILILSPFLTKKLGILTIFSLTKK